GEGSGPGVGRGNMPGVAEGDTRDRTVRLGRRRSPRLLDVDGHGVEEMYFVPLARQPARISARPAAHVVDDRGRRRKVARDDLLRPSKLEPARALKKTTRLIAAGIVRRRLGRKISSRRSFPVVLPVHPNLPAFPPP